MKTRKQLAAVLIGAVLAVGSAQVLADPQPNSGFGPGAMQGYNGAYGMGPGMMYGYGGYAMGPGAMHGYGAYGMGPGMMYGYGGYPMGPAAMHGYGAYGMGPGMMWGYGGGFNNGLNLTDEQRDKIGTIQQDLRTKQWGIMEKMYQEQTARWNGQDTATAQKNFEKIANLREQMFNNMLVAQKRIDAVLTKEQR